MPFPSPIARYLQARAVHGPWRIDGCADTGFAGAVVIPALAESPLLFATLASLSANPTEHLSRFLVLVVVNHREDAPPADTEDNRLTLHRLAAAAADFPGLRLAWVDAASPGKELPAKGGGVGLARKIGLDLALPRLDCTGPAPLLVSLDADTLVTPTYLPALVAHFKDHRAGGTVIPFRHREGKSPAEQDAIDRYELYLRHYVLGLALASSPCAFHTVGSAMACTAAAYVRAGGMNTRSAGEDFYFLQQLHRTSGVVPLRGTVVYPSPRPSHRVPFGTGRSVARTLTDGTEAITFYRPDCFRILGRWLALVEANRDASGHDLLRMSAAVSPHLASYLVSADFPEVRDRLRRQHRDDEAFLTGFHGWFDAFRTMKLIHHLAAGPYPRCGPELSLPELLAWAGMEPAPNLADQLGLLRLAQNGPESDGQAAR